MAHYFENDPNLKDEKGSYQVRWQEGTFTILTNSGIFSRDGLDTGTRVLLDAIAASDEAPKRILDFGCGTGVAGVLLHSLYPQAEIMGIDVSERAADMARENYGKAGIHGEVLVQDGLKEEDGLFDLIALNPPIRTGKETIYRLFQEASEHLTQDGSLWIVIRKQHGAASAQKYLQSLDLDVNRVARDLGFWVLKVTRKEEQSSAQTK